MKYHFFYIALLLASSVVLANESYQDTASNWLALVDNGSYDESWQGTSDRFKNRVSKAQWQMALEQVRTPLGDMLKRTPIDSQSVTSLPGMPDGKYQILKYNTEYQHKKDSVETLSLSQIDGKWYTIGYFIQ